MSFDRGKLTVDALQIRALLANQRSCVPGKLNTIAPVVLRAASLRPAAHWPASWGVSSRRRCLPVFPPPLLVRQAFENACHRLSGSLLSCRRQLLTCPDCPSCWSRLKTADTNRQPTCNPPAPSRIHARPREWSAWYL